MAARKGFTLVEMMVVAGVIAILALLAIPTYVDRIVRNQIIEAVPLANIVKPRIAAAWTIAQSFPRDNAEAGLPPAEKIVNNYISSITVQDGAIQIQFGNSAHRFIKGKILTLRPAVVEDAPIVPVAWVCGNGAVPGNMTVKGENRTNVSHAYLPMNCRG